VRPLIQARKLLEWRGQAAVFAGVASRSGVTGGSRLAKAG
jgi:hypothetical protein